MIGGSRRLAAGAAAALAALAAGPLAPSTAVAGKGPAFRYIHVAHIGGRGSGPGRFAGKDTQGPGGIAIDQVCGDVYITDRATDRIYRYTQRGHFAGTIGASGHDLGELYHPVGIFLENSSQSALNPEGPPTACGGDGELWVADEGNHRIVTFSPSGRPDSSWCNTALGIGGCDVVDSGPSGYPYDPYGISLLPHPTGIASVFVADLHGLVWEYDSGGGFQRVSDSTANGAQGVAAAGGALWSTYGLNQIGLFSLDPSSPTIQFVHAFGGAQSTTVPGRFLTPRGIATAANGEVYVIDCCRVQVFSATGRFLSQIRLPGDDRGFGVAVRYDGTVYATGERSYGADVYSPGMLVSLRRVSAARNVVALSGGVTPRRPGLRILLQRLTAGGWTTFARLRLDRRSRFAYTWRPPRRLVGYQVRAFFHDPKPYYADRASQPITVSTR
jgi:hypothetical protein